MVPCYFSWFLGFLHGQFKASFHTWFLWLSEVKWSEAPQLCPILCDPMDCSLPHSSVHGIFQARVLEWVAISFSYDLTASRSLKRLISFCIDQISQVPVQFLRLLEWLYCLIFFIFLWNIVAIQCYVSFCCRAKWISYCCLLFSHSVMSDSLLPHEVQHSRLPCVSSSTGACSNSCPLVSDALQPSHPLSSPSPPAFSLSQHKGLFQWVSSSHQVPKYCSFSISLSNEYSGLISFRTDWFDLLVVQGTLSFLQHHSWKASILKHSTFFIVQLSHQYMTTGKTILWLDGPWSAK